MLKETLITRLQTDARLAVGARAEHVTLEQALDWIAIAVHATLQTECTPEVEELAAAREEERDFAGQFMTPEDGAAYVEALAALTPTDYPANN